jgi:hypothetical protein
MRRFETNRWCTLVLALVLSVASVAAIPATGFAGKGTDGTLGSDALGGTITPPPQGSGDPDSPTGGGSPASAQMGGGAQTYGITPTLGVGDTAVEISTSWMTRVHLALVSLKFYYLRF